jgi:acetyl esterase
VAALAPRAAAVLYALPMSVVSDLGARLRPARDAIMRRALRLPRPVLRAMAGAPIRLDGRELDLETQLLLRVGRKLHKVAGSVPLDVARAGMEADALSVGPERRPMMCVEDRDLGAGVRARMYVPHEPPPPRPLLLFVHGGGFALGSIESHDLLARLLADEAGCVVLSVAYRLAPEHPYPAAVEDVMHAYARARELAKSRLASDGARIAVGGDSAGGNLSAVLCLEARRRGLPQPTAQLLFYPATDFTMSMPSHRTFRSGFLLEERSIVWYREQYVPDPALWTDPRVSPHFEKDVSGVAPAIVHTAGFDPLRDEGDAYARKLAAAGVRVEHTCHGGLIHGYANMGVLPAALEATRLAARQLREAFARAGAP